MKKITLRELLLKHIDGVIKTKEPCNLDQEYYIINKSQENDK